MNNIPLKDTDPMPYGKYSKKPDGPLTMANVPSDYLLYIYENNMCSKEVREYIKDNLDAINNDLNDEK